jgi:putative acetyltransferase
LAEPNRLMDAGDPETISQVRSLLAAYAELRDHDQALGDFDRELDELPGKYAPPGGALLIGFAGDEPAGCVAMHDLGQGICEMKRLFVLGRFQGRGLGRELVSGIISRAKARGYSAMRLDTHPWMEAAKALYGHFGFEGIPAYRYNPMPGVTCFELQLKG